MVIPGCPPSFQIKTGSISKEKDLIKQTIPNASIPPENPTLNKLYPICMETVWADNGGSIKPIKIPITIVNSILIPKENGNLYINSVTIGPRHAPKSAVYKYLPIDAL